MMNQSIRMLALTHLKPLYRQQKQQFFSCVNSFLFNNSLLFKQTESYHKKQVNKSVRIKKQARNAELVHSLSCEGISLSFLSLVILREMAPSDSSSMNPRKQQQNSSNFFILHSDQSFARQICVACELTTLLRSLWAASISLIPCLLSILCNSGISSAAILMLSSFSLYATPKIMYKFFLAQDSRPRKILQRSQARSPEGKQTKLAFLTTMTFLRRVNRCFWKLWNTDLFFLSTGRTSEVSLQVK